MPQYRTNESWASPLVEEALAPRPTALGGHRELQVHRGAPGDETGQSWHRRSASPVRSRPTTGRTWTHTRPRTGRGAHAVEFSKTVASLKKGIPSGGCAEHRCRRSGQKSIAASRLGAQSHPTRETRAARSAWRKVAQSRSDCVSGVFAAAIGLRLPERSRPGARARSGACRAAAPRRRRALRGTSSTSAATGSPSTRTPPCDSARRASERRDAEGPAISAGRCTVARARRGEVDLRRSRPGAS